MNPNFLARTMLPCSSSMATISASAPFPTVTLDLTHSANPLHLQKPPPPLPPLPMSPWNPSSHQGLLPQIFGQALYNNQSKFSGLQVSNVAQDQSMVVPGGHANGHQVQMQQLTQQGSLTDSVTAAIAADPNFTAALAAAISSIISGAHPSNLSNNAANLTASNNDNTNNNGSNGNATTSNSN